MAVRTKRLADGVSGPHDVTKRVYTCPAGRTAIVKDMRWSNLFGGATQTVWAVESGPRTTNLYFATTTAGGVPASLTCYVVLAPGESLVVNCDVTDGVGYHVSGTELVGVAT